MAWTEQAWRYSLAGMPDPAQGLDEQQTHLSLVHVSNASDLYVSSGLQWDYDESLTLLSIPHPAGFDITTRYALANVPAIGLSDSINRDGALTPTIDGFVPAFDGTITIPGVDGDIVTTLAGFTTSLVGAFQYRHYFDIAYSVTPTWVVREQPARFGDMTPTVGGFTVAYEGYSLPPDSTQGSLGLSLSGFAIDLDGTYTVPPTFTGDIGLDVEAFTTVFEGTVFTSGTTGVIDTGPDGFTTEFSGTFAKWSTDGDISLSLDVFTVDIDGQYTSSDATFGLIDVNVDGFQGLVRGSVLLPEDISKAVMRLDESEAKMWVNTTDTVKMRIIN